MQPRSLAGAILRSGANLSSAKQRALAEEIAGIVSKEGHAFFHRKTIDNAAKGHATASILCVSPDRKKVLLGFHKKHGRWQRLGGHCDGEIDVASVARRELTEESGIELASFPTVESICHFAKGKVPARPDEPSHFHYDIIFVVEVDPALPLSLSVMEQSALEWMDIDDKRIDGFERDICIEITAGLLEHAIHKQPTAPIFRRLP